VLRQNYLDGSTAKPCPPSSNRQSVIRCPGTAGHLIGVRRHQPKNQRQIFARSRFGHTGPLAPGAMLGDNRNMPKPVRFFCKPGALLLIAVAIVGTLAAAPASARQDRSRTEQAAAKKKLADVRSKMEALAREQAVTANHRNKLNAMLAEQARALAKAARAVHQTDNALLAKQQQLEQLQQQRGQLAQTLSSQRAAIAELLRATYALGHGSDLRLLLGDQDVGRIARALVYSQYFQQDRVQRVQQLMADLAKLQDLQDTITAEQAALESTRAQRQQLAAKLGRERAAQQKLAREANAQYQNQAQRLAALKRNAQSLNQLVGKLQEVLDESAAQASRRHGKPGEKPARASAGADIRGGLPWPAKGVVNSYGNGVLIKASAGSEVHAVASGRVIYAGFLRGYGMLLIVNHGDGWMSMYGNNESLLHNVGDQVEAGEAVGTASAPSGVNSGVYFELRKHGKPVDPRRWLSQHH
jgi:septal ring factor EnvC (AmiA/AmiB activator)